MRGLDNNVNYMNAFTESTAPPLVIYFKTDLRSEEAPRSSDYIKAVASLPTIFSRHWTALIKEDLTETLREKGIIVKAPASIENAFSASLERVPMVISKDAETIGLFEVSDWRCGLEAATTTLQKFRVFQYSKIGWHDPNEVILRIVHPSSSQESIRPIMDLVATWIANFQRESDLFKEAILLAKASLPPRSPTP
jgi:hypothetical protein